MDEVSILAHVVPLLTAQTENAATEAVAHLLARYPDARSALTGLVGRLGVELPSDLQYVTQAKGYLLSIPDLVGIDAASRERLIIESKFWAPLTAHQPGTYLRRLESGLPSLLLFISPKTRIRTLWTDLLSRAKDAKRRQVGEPVISDGSISCLLDLSHTIAAVAWDTVIANMRAAAQRNSDALLLSDLWQLESLCRVIDETAFRPLSQGELVSPTAKTLALFRDLVSDVVDECESMRIASTDRYGVASSRTYYRRYFTLHQIPNCSIEYNHDLRDKTPAACLWLSIPRARSAPRIPGSMPEGSFRKGRYLMVPLELAPHQERAYMVADLTRQCVDIAHQLGLDRE